MFGGARHFAGSGPGRSRGQHLDAAGSGTRGQPGLGGLAETVEQPRDESEIEVADQRGVPGGEGVEGTVEQPQAGRPRVRLEAEAGERGGDARPSHARAQVTSAPVGDLARILSAGHVAFWTIDGRVAAGMNVNVWDVTDAIQDLVRAGLGGATVDRAALADAAVPLRDLGS